MKMMYAERVRNMVEKLPEIRSQLAGYYDDLRRIEHEVYAFNEKFSNTIRAIAAVERFYPGEEKPIEKPKRRIIPFPAPAGTQAPAPAEHPAPGADPVDSYSECRAFVDYLLGLDNLKYLKLRIITAFYNLRISSLEKLAKTPPEKMRMQRGIGAKAVKAIRDALESNGIVSELWGIPEAAVTRQEN
jgi:hypothetical protein